MEKYKKLKTLGDGTFGSVVKAINKKTRQIVAIKKMKKRYRSWKEIINLAELKFLMRLHHPNIVDIIEIIKYKNELHICFEYLKKNVYQLTKDRKKPFNDVEVRNIMYQTLQGLAYMHRKICNMGNLNFIGHGYFHRDMKPENLLEYNNTIKIADFGLTKVTKSQPPYTDYVSTRWYRAPEIILRSTKYGPAIDIFACGAIMAELYRNWPLFPGVSEMDQMTKICKILGTPVKKDWPDGYTMARRIGYKFPQHPKQKWSKLIPSANDQALDLIKMMLNYNPSKRPSAKHCLYHPFFSNNVPIPKMPSGDKSYQTKKEVQQSMEYQEFQKRRNRRQQQQQLQIQKQQEVKRPGTMFYLKKARYRPGARPQEIIQNQ